MERHEAYHNITEYVNHLRKELEIEGAHGLVGNEMELIALVRHCPFLFDRSYSDFKNTDRKNEAWEAIAKVFNVNANEAKSYWTVMKDKFINYNENAKADPNVAPPYSYFEEMKFLDPFLPKKNFRKKILNEDSNDGESTEPEYNYLQSSTSLQINADVFINALKKEPILYDRKHLDFKNNDLKIRAWKRLSKEIKSTVPECVNRFKVLRDRYAKERKAGTKKWELYDKLSFLDPHILSKKRYSYTHMQGRKSASYNNVINNAVSSTDSTKDKNFIDSTNELNKMLAANSAFELKDFNRNNYLENPIDVEYHTPQTPQQNEDELFGLAIAAELKKVPDGRRKVKLKADIYKLLWSYQQIDN